LHRAYEAQLEGAFFGLTQAWQWLAAEKEIDLPGPAREKLNALIAGS